MDKKKLIIIIIGAILLLSVILGIGVIRHKSPYEHQLSLAYKYLEEGNYQEAIIAFTKAIEIDPNKTEAYLGRAESYIKNSDDNDSLTLALKDYEKVIELEETNAEGYLGAADVYIRQGEYDKALEILKLGLEKTNNDKRIAEKISELESGNIKDSSGRIMRSTSYDPSGKVTSYREYSYEGSVIKSSYFDENGKLTAYDVTTKNEKGLSDRYEFYDADGTLTSCYVYEYEFDEKGRISKVIDYDESGNYLGYSTKEYDNKGNMIKSSNYDENNMLEEYFVYEFDNSGKNSKLSAYDANGNLTHTTKNE